jgi:hypothetical protein
VCQAHNDVGPFTDVVGFAFVTTSLMVWRCVVGRAVRDVSLPLKMKALLPSKTSTDAY